METHRSGKWREVLRTLSREHEPKRRRVTMNYGMIDADSCINEVVGFRLRALKSLSGKCLCYSNQKNWENDTGIPVSSKSRRRPGVFSGITSPPPSLSRKVYSKILGNNDCCLLPNQQCSRVSVLQRINHLISNPFLCDIKKYVCTLPTLEGQMDKSASIFRQCGSGELFLNNTCNLEVFHTIYIQS